MTQLIYEAAHKPTIYFIGVTTLKSSIMKVFPEWARYLQLGDCQIKGMDFKWHDEPERYRCAVQFIKEDPLSLGSLVTTHKLDLLKACRDQFEIVDEYAELMGEISSISKRGHKLVGHAKDPIGCGLALEAFLPANYWKETGAEVLVLGAGGSSIAVTWYLMKHTHANNRPARIIVTNRTIPRLEQMKDIHKRLGANIPVEYHHTPNPNTSDHICRKLKPGSLVINATGLGKDAPGSPLTDAAQFPEYGMAWDFNYRGDLLFLDQARAQSERRHLTVEDGWIYFLHGWTRVIAEVFHVHIPTAGLVFDELSRIAAGVR
jgi:shikimate 5-dehydrogenase